MSDRPSSPAVLRGQVLRDLSREDLFNLHKQIEGELPDIKDWMANETEFTQGDRNKIMELGLIEDELAKR